MSLHSCQNSRRTSPHAGSEVIDHEDFIGTCYLATIVVLTVKGADSRVKIRVWLRQSKNVSDITRPVSLRVHPLRLVRALLPLRKLGLRQPTPSSHKRKRGRLNTTGLGKNSSMPSSFTPSNPDPKSTPLGDELVRIDKAGFKSRFAKFKDRILDE